MPLSLLFAAALALPPAPPSDDTINRLVRETLKSWQAPGLALVIVHQDQVYYLNGFGLRAVGKEGQVTADTVFPLASCSKSFTALGLGMLVDDKKLAWDDPVYRHVPYFRLKDPFANSEVRLRDLLCHRVGVGRHDYLWYRSPWKLEERIRRLAYLDQQHSFRSSFEYQTVLFGTAGVALQHAAGISWEEFMRRRILTPLQMKNSWPTFPGAQVKDLAEPHRKNLVGTVETMPRYPLEDPDPAGSVHTCARDLGTYLRFQLGSGEWAGQALVSARSLHEPHTSQVVIPRDDFTRVMNPHTHLLTYGLGWVIQDYRGQPMILHGGAIDGFRTQLTLVPELRLAVGALNNLDKSFMNLALTNALVDLFLGEPAKDWNRYYLDIQEHEDKRARARPINLRLLRHPDTKPSHPLQDYAGVYHDPALGDMTLQLKQGQLHWSWQGRSGPLEHFHYDTFLANGELFIDAPFTFQLDDFGHVVTLRALDRSFARQRGSENR